MLELFAQMPPNRNQFGNNNPGGPPPEGILAIVFGFYCILFLVIIAAFICRIILCIRMSQCLQAVHQRNRKMEPGMVWLNLVPMLDLVWVILSVLWIADSLKAEYDDRGLESDNDHGRTMGIIYFASNLLCAPVGIILLFLYRSKLGTYLDELNRNPGNHSRSRRDEPDDYDDEPPRRRDNDY
jgi:hypothetical protein